MSDFVIVPLAHALRHKSLEKNCSYLNTWAQLASKYEKQDLWDQKQIFIYFWTPENANKAKSLTKHLGNQN